jgi:ATP-binding cassette, subfamily B, bacterial
MASTLLLSVVSGITPAATAMIAQWLLDAVLLGIKQGTISPIWLPVGFQLVLNMLDRFFTRLNVALRQLLQDRVSDHVQMLILTRANRLDLAQFEDAEFYDKLRHASQDANNKPAMMTAQICDLLRATMTLISMLFLLSHLAWWLLIGALIVPIPSFIATSRYGWKGYWLARRQSPERRLQRYITQVLTVDMHNKEIKLFNLGDFFLQRFYELAEKLYQENKRLILPRELLGLWWGTLSAIANSGIYLYVALQAVLRSITPGQLTRYVIASNQAGQSFQQILDALSDAYENHLFVNTLFEFLEYEPRIVSPQHPLPIALLPYESGLEIEFRHVSFTYPGKEQPALKNVSFTLRVGEAIALVGGNGAGKTTLVKLLTRLYDPDEGEIIIGGHSIKDYDPKVLREQIGVIFQDFMCYQMTAQENIGIGRVAEIKNGASIRSAAEKSGADPLIQRLSAGYETMLGRWFEKGVELSGGEWQKVALARAFMRNAPILILDEPTSALDAQAESDVFTRFRQLTRNKTTIFISHRFSTVRLADRILVIEQGSIIESGSHQELMGLRGRYAELFNLQAQAYST